MSTLDPDGTVVTPQHPDTVRNFTDSPVEGATVPYNWGKHWREALREADERLVRLKVVGDSISFGYTAITREDTAWELVMAELQDRFGDGGSGLTTMSWMPAFITDLMETPITVTPDEVAWEFPFNVGYGGSAIVTSTSGASFTVPNQRGRHLSVCHETALTYGVFTVSVNDTVLETVDCAAAPSMTRIILDVPVDVEDGYDVTITALDTLGLVFHAIDCYNDTGVVLHNLAKPGGTSGIGSAAIFGSGGTLGFLLSLTDVEHDLLVMAFGVNDNTATLDPEIFFNNMAGFGYFAMFSDGIDGTRLADGLVVSTHVGNNVANTYHKYVAKNALIADSFGMAHMNFNALIPAATTGDNDTAERIYDMGLATAPDAVHPGPAGHFFYAEKYLDLLT